MIKNRCLNFNNNLLQQFGKLENSLFEEIEWDYQTAGTHDETKTILRGPLNFGLHVSPLNFFIYEFNHHQKEFLTNSCWKKDIRSTHQNWIIQDLTNLLEYDGLRSFSLNF